MNNDMAPHDDPELRLTVTGGSSRELARPTGRKFGRRHLFEVEDVCGDIVIVSRSFVPAAIDAAAADLRRLGVPLRGIVLRGIRIDLMIHADDAALKAGFHQAEAGHRWTDGAGVLPRELLAPLGRDFTLELILADAPLRYGPDSTSTKPVLADRASNSEVSTNKVLLT